MPISKNQRFGIITFIVLLVAAYLVTTEPWKKDARDLQTSMVAEVPPVDMSLLWDHLSLGYPMASTTDTIRSYTGFDLGYNEQFEQASWVVYILTRDEVQSDLAERTDNFRADTTIKTGSAEPEDYRGSGFDRGHLAPAGDMKWDWNAMSESFLMSNMSPQDPSFNRGVWRRLEEMVRKWAVEKDSIYVISGPLLEPIDTLIGGNGVGVPALYFKVLVDLSPPDHSFMAFLLPNRGSSSDPRIFAITVDSLETVTGYDFFSAAPNQPAIDWMEKQLDIDSWF